MFGSLHERHQALREQLIEFGIDSYIVGQKVDDGARSFQVAEVDHTSKSSRAVLRERDKLQFPGWMGLQVGARYMIVRYFDDRGPDKRDTVSEFTVFGEGRPEEDALHAAYVPLAVPLDYIKIESTQSSDQAAVA
jgi:hypothetical protein